MSDRTVISLAIAFFLTLLSDVRPVVADDHPADLQRLLSQHEQQMTKLKQDQGKQQDTLLKKLRSDLKELQDEYTQEALLDEAVAIRDCLRRLNEYDQFDLIFNSLKSEKDSLPTEASATINQFTEPAQELITTRDESLRNANESHRTKLRELLDKYTKASDLDASLAVRQALNAAVGSKASAPAMKSQPIEVDLEFPSEFEAAEQKYKEQVARLQLSQQERTSALMKSMMAGLMAEQGRATRAGKLDDAVCIRDLIKLLDTEPSHAKKVELTRGNSGSLKGDARAVVEGFLQGNQQIAADLQKEMARLNQAFAPVVEGPIKAALKAGDEPKSRQLLERHLVLLNRPPMAYYHHQKPTFSKESLHLVEPFEAETAARKQACEESEVPVRNRLIEGFRSLVSAQPSPESDEGSKAINLAIEFFTADYTTGPQRGRLFVPDDKLPAAAVELFNEYCRESMKLEQKLASDQAAAAKTLREELHPVLERHTEANQFLEAWTILARGAEFDRVQFETPVKFAHVPHWKDHLKDAVVLDVRKNAVRVRESAHHPDGEWFPRGRIRFAPGDTIAETKFGDPIPGPGSAVTDKTTLKRGQTVFYIWGRSALEATIVDLTESNVVLKYKERWSSETVLRTQLWVLDDY